MTQIWPFVLRSSALRLLKFPRPGAFAPDRLDQNAVRVEDMDSLGLVIECIDPPPRIYIKRAECFLTEAHHHPCPFRS